MKIGTDSVLLGAWTPLGTHPESILDIGAGTGILSLMMAQRCAAQTIDAVEIDDHAFEQCVGNFEQSPWGDRLFCYHASLEAFVDEIDDTYDLIICNPPFYSETYQTNNSSRNLARFQNAMPFELLLKTVSKFLSKKGEFSIILPHKESLLFIDMAAKFNLFPNKIAHVKGQPTSHIKRSLILFSYNATPSENDLLIIENKRHQYTSDYIELTKDFYLKM